jgi:hypothetical protein
MVKFILEERLKRQAELVIALQRSLLNLLIKILRL